MIATMSAKHDAYRAHRPEDPAFMRHAFSVDCEDWYHGIELPPSQWEGRQPRLEPALETLLAILDGAGTRVTFFCLGWIAEHHPTLVRRVAEAGHEIGSHGYAHQKVYEQTPEAFRADLLRTKSLLEDLTGRPVRGHRSPYFSITRDSLWALPILRECGFQYDCSISPVVTWRYGIAGSPETPYRIADCDLVEFPISSFRLLGRRFGTGGAYLRILPYALTARALRRKTRQGLPGMIYVHPWEFDPSQPVVAMSWKTRLTHYFNLRGTAERVGRLLGEFPFAPAAEILQAAPLADTLPCLRLADLVAPESG
ncbi:MAG: DUF3473 domain-containing protein [Candidatus Eisenbacteria bacterium]|nr:DUF3473 domain-containing protein [Candidatus Eisenbacteria bacterium]